MQRHSPPTLETERLFLRTLRESDAPEFAKLAGQREIAHTTISIPHPCSEQQARDWIHKNCRPSAPLTDIVFAINPKAGGQLIGTAGLRSINAEHGHAELGFWIGVPFWRQGYATEAAAAVVRFGFEHLKLNRVFAHHMASNPASGRVLQKIGMKPEGLLRQHVRKWGEFQDVRLLAILNQDFKPELEPGMRRFVEDFRQSAK